MKTNKDQKQLLNDLITELNNYPANQNVRPTWALSSDKSEVLYYRMWSDITPERRLPIDIAIKCNDAQSLQKLMGV